MNTTACAKINLCLDILGKRPDGYHEMNMLMQTVALHDDIELRPAAGKKVSLSVLQEQKGDLIPSDDRNLMVRAANLFLETFKGTEGAGGLELCLTKRIPAAAGLAGGSADAAAVLRMMRDLFKPDLGEEELLSLALKLGADVPFCLKGGCAVCRGIGEKMKPVQGKLHFYVTAAVPAQEVSTARIYALYDEMLYDKMHGRMDMDAYRPDPERAAAAFAAGDKELFLKSLGNVLEPVTASVVPEVLQLKEQMFLEGALKAMMTGSGPTVFGLFEDRNRAEACAEKLRAALGNSLRSVFLTSF